MPGDIYIAADGRDDGLKKNFLEVFLELYATVESRYHRYRARKHGKRLQDGLHRHQPANPINVDVNDVNGGEGKVGKGRSITRWTPRV